MEDTTVALAAMGLAGTALAAIIWLAKYFAKELSKDLRAHTKAAEGQILASEKQAKSSESAAKASNEVLVFMKKLNGKLESAYMEKVKEIKVKEK